MSIDRAHCPVCGSNNVATNDDEINNTFVTNCQDCDRYIDSSGPAEHAAAVWCGLDAMEEIARLRTRLAECEAAVDQCVALAEYIETAAKGAMVERIRTALSTKFAQDRAAELAALRRDAERLEWMTENEVSVERYMGGYACRGPADDAHNVWATTAREAIDRARGVR